MRYIELFIYILVFLMVISWWIKKIDKAIFIYGGILSVILLALHGFIEGFRWQMYFVYALVLICIIFSILKIINKKHKSDVIKVHKKSHRILKNISKVIAIILMIFTGVLLWLFPVNNIPSPTGNYKIGTVSYEITDEDRIEIYGEENGEARRIRFQVWYPADSIKGGQLTKWMTDGKVVATGIPNMFDLPLFLLDHTALIDSNSYSDIAISSKETNYPVVIISHGWTGFMNIHSDFAEMLASHGYIVVSINHTYGATVSAFDDGEVVYVDYDALPDRDSVDDFEIYSHALVNTYSLDEQLVIDFLENYPIDTGVLENRINMDRIALLGHSTGGGAIVKTAIEDKRIKAIIGLDAWVEPVDLPILEKGLLIPSLFIRSEQWQVGINNKYLEILMDKSEVDPLIYQINGCNHQDFSMLYIYNPISKLFGFSGTLDNEENASIQRDYILTFFNEILSDSIGDVTNLIEEYEDVQVVDDFPIE